MNNSRNNKNADIESRILKLKPNSIFDIIDKSFFFELETSHDEYLKCGNYYEIYYAIAKYYAPKSILEIGVRYGYSLASMMCGGASSIKKVAGYDIDQYEENSLSIAESNIKKHLSNIDVEYSLELKNSQSISRLDGVYDIIHIDGDHSYQGKLHDLNLALHHSKIIIVDDYNHLLDVRRAVIDWVDANKIYIKNTCSINSIRGTFIIEINMENLPDKCTDAIIINGIYCLPGDSDITSHIQRTGTLKWDQPFSLITQILGPGNGRIMVDIGAYIGDSVKWFIDDGWDCHAFEPQKDAYDCLVLNVGNDCKTYNTAIGDNQLFSMYEQTHGNLGARSLDLGGNQKAVPLDLLINKADFIKIDAEGFEPFILDGCKRILETNPLIAIEINHPGLSKYGFTEDDILKHFKNYIAIETYFYADYQYDLLLIPIDKYSLYKEALLKHPFHTLKIKHIQ